MLYAFTSRQMFEMASHPVSQKAVPNPRCCLR